MAGRATSAKSFRSVPKESYIARVESAPRRRPTRRPYQAERTGPPPTRHLSVRDKRLKRLGFFSPAMRRAFV
jgi:hypothetical protein